MIRRKSTSSGMDTISHLIRGFPLIVKFKKIQKLLGIANVPCTNRHSTPDSFYTIRL